MANVDFQTLSKTGFANLFGVDRMVPGHSSDLHVHGVIPRLGRVKPTEAGNLICACSACEFYDKRFGTNPRMVLNGKRGIEAGKFPALQPPPTYDSGTQWGLPGPDIQILGTRVLESFRSAMINAPPKAVAQDKAHNAQSVELAKKLQEARTVAAYEGFAKDAAAIAEDPSRANYLLGVRNKTNTGVKRSATTPPETVNARFEAAKRPIVPAAQVSK